MSGSKAGSSSEEPISSIDRFRSRQDLEYLDELLRDFGVPGHPSADAALRIIFDRWQIISSRIAWLAERALSISHKRGIPLHSALKELAVVLHEFMYDEILNNGGKYRQKEDPFGGRVYFGGQKGNTRESKYEGALPENIESEIDIAFACLSDTDDPVRASCLFYLEFSAVHPFYDANGRIGRAIVSVYLYIHGFYMNWSQIDERHSQFIRKINNCISRRGWKERYIEYQAHLIRFWARHVERIDEFMPPHLE